MVKFGKEIIEIAEREFADGVLNRNFKKAVLWLGRLIVAKKDYIELEYSFSALMLYKDLISTLTYKEFMNIYPVAKEYDGDKYGFKDYWSTMEYLKDKDLDNRIGDNAMDLLLNYWSEEIWIIGSTAMGIISDFSVATTGLHPVDELLCPETIPHDSKGNLIGVTADGKVHKVPAMGTANKFTVIKGGLA